MMEFAYPWVLLLLLLLPLIGCYLVYWRKRPSIVVSTAVPFRGVRARRRPTFPQLCMLFGAAVLIVALARPRYGDEKVMIRSQGIDIILAVDMSGSMQAFDVPQSITSGSQLARAVNAGEVKNRLEVAKDEIRRFIEARPNDRIGLIGFAQLAYSLAPPTLDHAWLLAHLDRLEPGMIGDATGIASPLASGVNRLKKSDAPRRVLVLFTDGRNTAENRLTPEQAAALAKEFYVVIHTVGIGSRNAFFLVNGFGGSRFERIQDEFDEKLLRSLAEITGGSYFHAADADGMKQVMDQINQLEKTTIEQPKYIEFREYAPRLALVALGLLLLGFIADTTWCMRLP